MNERIAELQNEVQRLRKIVWFSVAFSSMLAIGLFERPLTAKINGENLVVHQLSIVDAHGIERVLIYDAKRNERGGYITDNGAGNALLTLDDGSGEDQVTIVSYSDRGAEFGLRNHAETRFYVSALNDRTALKLQHKGTILLSQQSAK